MMWVLKWLTVGKNSMYLQVENQVKFCRFKIFFSAGSWFKKKIKTL